MASGSEEEPYYPPEEDAEEDDVGFLDPESPLLAGVQARIQSQLESELERISLELKEKREELKNVNRRREDIGVDLYGVQQRLAKLQEGLEKGHDNFNTMSKIREAVEIQRDEHIDVYDSRKVEINSQRQKMLKYQSELDKLNQTLMQVSKYNEDMESRIEVNRRETYKVEEEMKTIERDKRSQDYVIESLQQQLKSLHEQQAMFEAQLTAQRKETKLAAETLAEATSEMEAVQFEKKQLAQQWKSSLIGMQRRDEALMATQAALAKQEEQILALENEASGYQLSIKQEQERNEKLTAILTKAENESAFLQKQMETLLEKKEKLSSKYSLLKRSLDSTDAESARVEQEGKIIQSEIDGVEKQVQKTMQAIRQVEDEILETLSEQTTLKKGSQATIHEIEKIKNAIRDKEMNVAQLQNELARIRVDALNTNAHNIVLKSTLEEVEADIKQKDSLIERFELEIRRRNDEIERKQKSLDKLNRKFDEIMAAFGGGDEAENVGPLEATIHNMQKQIVAKVEECDGLQREWVRGQTELVALVNDIQSLTDEIQYLRSQVTVLSQKRLRMDGSNASEKSEVADLEKSMSAMHHDMTKLNEQISKNSRLQQLLADTNFNMENEIVARLKDLEVESIRLEADISTTRDEKRQLMNSIIEAERAIMQWEKKIQLCKETIETLNPEVGQDEITRMKREIHIMDARLAQLKREQKKRLEDMEKAVYKRELITVKGRAATQSSSKKVGVTKATVQREVAVLSKELSTKKKEAADKDQQIKDLLRQADQAAKMVADLASRNGSMRRDLTDIQQEVATLQMERAKMVEEKLRIQRMVQRYRDSETGKYKPVSKPEAYQVDLDRAADRASKARQLIERYMQEFPGAAEELEFLLVSSS